MSYAATVFKCMIASPSDVSAERSVVREVLHEWNVVNADARKVVLLPVGWETHSVPEMGDRPQAIINKQVLRGCDLLVGVFWTRIGTATGEYESGTVEEIEEHIVAGGRTMLYFSAAPVVPDSIDGDQYARLKAFKQSCRDRGLFETYDDVSDFRGKLYRQLQLKMNRDPFFLATATAELGQPIAELPQLPKMTKEAAFLLKECARDPATDVLNISFLSGHSIQVRGKNLIEENNPRSEATWKSALAELESLGYLKSEGPKRQIFKLTRDGFDAADRLP
jgi:hypothetical protein